MKLRSNPINIVDPRDPSELPIYVMTEGLELPEKGSYYLISGDGIWFRKDTGLLHAMIKVNGIGAIPKVVQTVGLRIPETPKAIMFQALMFFRYIWKKHSSECVLLLVYVEDTQQYGFVCPKQRVTRSTVSYEADDFRLSDNALVVGTIHSHCNFSAFHSGTDQRDEVGQDGIHVTIGNVDDNHFTVSSCLAVNGLRATVDPMKYLGGMREVKHNYGGLYHTGNPSIRYALDMTLDEQRAYLRVYKALIKRWAEKVTSQGGHSSFFGFGGTSFASAGGRTVGPLPNPPRPISPSTVAGSGSVNASGGNTCDGVPKSWNAIGVPAQREAPPPTEPVQKEQQHKSRPIDSDDVFAGLYDDDSVPPDLDQNDLLRKFHERGDGCD